MDTDTVEFEEWFLKHDVDPKDLGKVIQGNKSVYFFTTTILLFKQFKELKELREQLEEANDFLLEFQERGD